MTNSLMQFRFRHIFVWVLPIAILLGQSINQTTVSAHDLATELYNATNVFIESLDEKQTGRLLFSFDDDLRKDWQFVPMDRKGISFKELKPNQRWLALSMLQTALSHRGFSQSMQIMSLEQILHELENNSPKRDAEKYHLFVFGKPSVSESWGWRVEGHHLSVSFTILEGKKVVTTPAFLGSNPAEVRQGPQKGLRVLGLREDLGRQLVKSLTVEQKEKAIISEQAPKDIINGPGRNAELLQPLGIAASDLSEQQRDTLRKIIGCYVETVRPELAEDYLQKIEVEGFDKVHFAWAGKIVPGKPHYYRVQGTAFILEYDNTQNNANHVHAVWRDLKNDFGEDVLRQHYEQKHSAQE